MKDNYIYPVDYERPKDEIITIIDMFQKVEQSYETGVSVQAILESYQAFKKVVPSIGEEKQLGREFEKMSGYSLYRAIQAAKSSKAKKIKL